jgi:nuclear GTP-binding protein
MLEENKELQGSKCFGADLVMSLLANYCRSRGIKTSISVGVVGKWN